MSIKPSSESPDTKKQWETIAKFDHCTQAHAAMNSDCDERSNLECLSRHKVAIPTQDANPQTHGQGFAAEMFADDASWPASWAMRRVKSWRELPQNFGSKWLKARRPVRPQCGGIRKNAVSLDHLAPTYVDAEQYRRETTGRRINTTRRRELAKPLELA